MTAILFASLDRWLAGRARTHLATMVVVLGVFAAITGFDPGWLVLALILGLGLTGWEFGQSEDDGHRVWTRRTGLGAVTWVEGRLLAALGVMAGQLLLIVPLLVVAQTLWARPLSGLFLALACDLGLALVVCLGGLWLGLTESSLGRWLPAALVGAWVLTAMPGLGVAEASPLWYAQRVAQGQAAGPALPLILLGANLVVGLGVALDARRRDRRRLETSP